jgi:PhnB protein
MPKPRRPQGHHDITPGLSVHHAAKVITFLEQAFDGRVVDRYEGPGGSIAHAEVMVGDSVVMLGDPMQGMKPMPAMFSRYVDDAEAVDATYRRALQFGATSVREPANQFYGYRSATVQDVGGNQWTICAVIEDLTHEEIQARMAKMTGNG